MLLAVIFGLGLTLANAVALQHNTQFANAHDYAPLQLTKGRASHYEWDMFIARELGAIVVTALLFGTIANSTSYRRRTKAHQQFAAFIANRRR